MTDTEKEAGIRKNYRIRNRRMFDAVEGGLTRLEERRLGGELCMICHRREHGGGLFLYRQRDGQEVLAGATCSLYVDYLIAHPNRVAQFR